MEYSIRLSPFHFEKVPYHNSISICNQKKQSSRYFSPNPYSSILRYKVVKPICIKRAASVLFPPVY